MPITRTIKVQTRHSVDCKYRSKGADFKGCKCPKILRVYDGGGSGANRRIAAGTRDWEEAERQAQALRDRMDPVKQELTRLKAAQEAKQVTIERAVVLYTADMAARKVAPGTVQMTRSLLGHVDAKTHDVTNPGHLFGWLAKIPGATRPVYIADLTTALLTEWRGTWKFSDYTGAQRWGMVKSFFNFCVAQGWLTDNPARKLRRIEYKAGSRTAIFDDKQYDAILEAVTSYEPENVPHITKSAWQQRLTTFLELLRWSGMALIDAVQYEPGLVDDEGVLRYKRQKTGELATVQLPDRLLALLRSVPLERDSVGNGEPFRMKDFDAHSDTVTWRKRLMKLFVLAGITEVRNELGKERPAHPHMLRDTFAVWNLRHGVPLHAVSKMLGHRNPVTTAKAYLPFVKELEKATIAEGRAALKQAELKPMGRKVVNITKR
jgi:integrase